MITIDYDPNLNYICESITKTVFIREYRYSGKHYEQLINSLYPNGIPCEQAEKQKTHKPGE